MACGALDQSTGFVPAMLRFVDCEVQSVGAGGYAALAAPGSTLSVVLTGLLTLFVALFGYRLLVGHTPSVRDGVLAMVKIGVVLVMATSWPAYRTLVYDVALRGPAELAASVGGPAQLPGTSSGMVARLDFADRALTALAIAGTGPTDPQEAQSARRVPPPFAGFDAFAFGGARILFLIGVIGAFAAVRIVAGLLLALGPLFFAFLLFDATRGLFEGWLRVLVGAALGGLGVSIVFGIELALIAPWLVQLLALRAAGLAIPNAPVELLVVALVFCAVLAAMLWAMARLAMGFRLPAAWQTASRLLSTVRADHHAARSERRGTAPAEDRSRAAAIVDSIAASQRREGNAIAAAVTGPQPRTASQAPVRDVVVPVAAPLGQSFRRTGTRVSASAGRRDRIA